MKLILAVFALIATLAAVYAQAPNSEYLPPGTGVGGPSDEYLPPPLGAEPAHTLADDGYRYKRVRRLRLRHRRRRV